MGATASENWVKFLVRRRFDMGGGGTLRSGLILRRRERGTKWMGSLMKIRLHFERGFSTDRGRPDSVSP